jgi:phosphoglycerate dehydrogenase-like enzyme
MFEGRRATGAEIALGGRKIVFRARGEVNSEASPAPPDRSRAGARRRRRRAEEPMSKPLIVVDPQPRGLDEIFDAGLRARLESLGEVIAHEGPGRMPAAQFEALLPRMELLLGQSDMPRERLTRAPRLRAIINVETNFLQNVDYEACFARGVHVLTPSSAFARPVAEMTLGLAIDLCRGITRADRAMRAGTERWLLDGWPGSSTLYGASVGLIGFGDLARAFTPLLAPFGCSVQAYDPWVSDHFMAGFGVKSASLDEVLSTSRVIAVFAAVTSQNQGFLGKREFELITPGSVFLLMSRAGVVDFPELLRQAESGRFRAATDVFPVEPAPPDDPARRNEGLVLSPHRAGATPGALLEIGRQAVADAELILKGLPPMSCRRAQRETVAMSRSKPIE